MTKYEPLPGNTYAQHEHDDEIDLRQLFSTLWAGKWLILAVTILFAAGGVAYAKPISINPASCSLPPMKKAEWGGFPAN